MNGFEVESNLGTFLVKGEGYFDGEDVVIGEKFIDILVNEGMYVNAKHELKKGKDTLKVAFSTQKADYLIM